MARIVARQNSMAGGVIAPQAQGRADLQKFLSGARRLTNMIPQVHGSVINRAGTEYISHTRPALADQAVRPWDPLYPSDPEQIYSAAFLVDFEYSEEDTYTLEIGRMYLRPFRNGAPILESSSTVIHDITNAPAGHPTRTLVEMTGASTPWKHGDMVWIDNCEGNTVPNGRYWYVRRFEGLGAAIATVTDTAGTARVVTISAHGFANSEIAYLDNVSGEMGNAVNDQLWTISYVDDYTFDLVGSSVAGKAQGTGGGCDCIARVNWAVGGGIADNQFYLMDLRMEDVDSTSWASYTQDSGDATRRFELRGNRPEDKADLLYEESEVMGLHRSQFKDLMDLVHENYAPRELTRIAHNDWTIAVITFQPSIGTPSVSVTSGSGTDVSWYVTAIDAVTAEESLPGTVQSADPNPSGGGGTAVTIQWNAVSGAKYYYVYRDDQTFRRAGFVGIVDNDGAGPFQFATAAGADAIEPDFTIGPPKDSTPFIAGDGSGDCPRVIAFHQQRLFIGSTLNSPQQLWASVVGTYYNLSESVPVFVNDALNFIVASTKENEIRNITSLEDLIVQTSAREFTVTGSGGKRTVITAEAGGVDIAPETHVGSSPLQTLEVEDGALYVADTGPEVRSLAYKFEKDGYAGSDLSVLVPHFMKGYSLVDCCWAHAPYRIAVYVRSDGAVLFLTLHTEHNVWAWSEMATEGGGVTSVCATREGRENAIYFNVERTIDGELVRYIERLHSRDFRDIDGNADVKNAFFVDCGLSYDDPHPIYPGYDETRWFTIPAWGAFRMEDYDEFTEDSDWSGGPNWDGDWVDLDGFEGGGGMEEYLNGKRFYVRNVDSFLHVIQLAKVNSVEDDDYEEVDATKMAAWTPTRFGTIRKAVQSVTGAYHLEGEEVAILANGNVAARQTVTDGVITLGPDIDKASRIHIGIPMRALLETLDAEVNDPQNSIAYYPQSLEGCALMLLDSRGIQWGPDEDNLTEHPERALAAYGGPLPLLQGIIKTESLPLTGDADHARVVVVQDYPLPLEILAVIREVDVKIGER